MIEDPVEARRRIDRFLDRAARRDAYGELLATGKTSRRFGDPEAREHLRRDLRRQARADKLPIITREYDDLVIAMLNRPISGDLELEAFDAIREAHAVADVARCLGHQPRVFSREHVESMAYCTACNMLGHADATADDVVLAGPLYSEPCLA